MIHAALLALLVGTGCAGKGSVDTDPAPTEAVEPLYVDLSEPVGAVTVSVPPGRYRVVVQNRRPNAEYIVRAVVRNIPVPALNLPATKQPDIKPVVGCEQALEDAITSVGAAASEAEVAEHVAALERLRTRPVNAPCLVRADAAIRSTRSSAQHMSVAAGQELHVTVQRLADDAPDRVWTRVFSAGQRGEWRTGYGFTFVRRAWTNHARYHAADSSGAVVIRRMREADRMDYIPSIFFSWMPTAAETRNVSFGATGGVGFDLTRVAVMLGAEATWNQNLSLSAGVSFHQQQRLLGQYREGQTVGSTLTEAQLHEPVFALNPYIAFTIRSLTNPFERR